MTAWDAPHDGLARVSDITLLTLLRLMPYDSTPAEPGGKDEWLEGMTMVSAGRRVR